MGYSPDVEAAKIMVQIKPIVLNHRKEKNLVARILLVEDHEMNRQLLSDFLNYLGYEVFCLAEGSSFFQMMSQFRPDLVLLDLKIPGIDGYTILQQIQQESHWQQVPVIVVSAYAFKSDRQRALDLGAKRYFVKPVNLSQLQQAIEEDRPMNHP